MKRYLFGFSPESQRQQARTWIFDNDFIEVQNFGSPSFGKFADIHAIKAGKAGVTEVLVRVIPREGNEPSRELEALEALLSWKLKLPGVRRIVAMAPAESGGPPGFLDAYDEIVQVTK